MAEFLCDENKFTFLDAPPVFCSHRAYDHCQLLQSLDGWRPAASKALLHDPIMPVLSMHSNDDAELEQDIQARLDERARQMVAARLAREAEMRISHAASPGTGPAACAASSPPTSPSQDLRRAVDRPQWRLDTEDPAAQQQSSPTPGMTSDSASLHGFDMPLASPQGDAVRAADAQPWRSPKPREAGPAGVLKIGDMRARAASSAGSNLVSPLRRSPRPPRITGEPETDAGQGSEAATADKLTKDHRRARKPHADKEEKRRANPEPLVVRAARFGFVLTAIGLCAATAGPRVRDGPCAGVLFL